MRRSLSLVALAAVLGLLAACSSDDGGTVRSEGDSSSGSDAGSGSDADSGSGLSGSDLGTEGPHPGTTSNDPTVTRAANDYKTWLQSQVAALRIDAKKFTDAVRAGNVAEAKKQYAPSRYRWETIEPISILVPGVGRPGDPVEGAHDPNGQAGQGPGDPANQDEISRDRPEGCCPRGR